jgi:hypothetical protein
MRLSVCHGGDLRSCRRDARIRAIRGVAAGDPQQGKGTPGKMHRTTRPEMRLTLHFTLRELVRSYTAERLGIDNAPSERVLERLPLQEELRVDVAGFGQRLLVVIVAGSSSASTAGAGASRGRRTSTATSRSSRALPHPGLPPWCGAGTPIRSASCYVTATASAGFRVLPGFDDPRPVGAGRFD